MNFTYKNIVISEPIIVNGLQTYEHMKFYIRKYDNKVCMFIDHGDGSGYLEDNPQLWSSVSSNLLMHQPHMRFVMGWS